MEFDFKKIIPQLLEMFLGKDNPIVSFLSNLFGGGEQASNEQTQPSNAPANPIANMLGVAPANAAEQPRATNVSQTTTVAANSNVKVPQGETNIVFLDVGHSGSVLQNGKAMTQEQLNNLTYKQLTDGLANKTISINPGIDPGAISPFDKQSEFELNVKQAVAAADALRANGLKPHLNVQADDGIKNRADKSNQMNAAAFISFHNNAGGGNGSEVFFKAGDSESERFAKQIMANMEEKGYPTRGAKPDTQTQHGAGGLGVTRNQSDRPVVLMEGVFMDKQEDYDRTKNPQFFADYAAAISNSVKQSLVARGYGFGEQPQQNVQVASTPDNSQGRPLARLI
jgi:N-acetylmuramoyl-L-alanine amidase